MVEKYKFICPAKGIKAEGFQAGKDGLATMLGRDVIKNVPVNYDALPDGTLAFTTEVMVITKETLLQQYELLKAALAAKDSEILQDAIILFFTKLQTEY